MKLFKKILSLTFIFFLCSINARRAGTDQPENRPKPIPIQKVPIPAIQQQPLQQAPSYAQALEIIKTKMLPNQILVNNMFTQNFITFVQSLNLSDLETKSLLEAGANIHTVWSNNNQTNKQIVSSLKNTIQVITQTKPAPQQVFPAQQKKQPIQPATPAKPAPPMQPIPVQPISPKKPSPAPAPKPATPIKPAPPIKPVAQPAPVKKVEPVKQPLPTQNYSITNNVIMTLDPRKKETVEKGAESMVQQALVGLYQKAAPVIMTNNVFEIIIKVKQQIGEQNLQKLRTMGYQQLFNAAQQLAQKISIRGISSLVVIVLSYINFDSNNLNCYFHKSENLVLLIPKEYIRANIPKVINASLNDQARACGFNPEVLRSVTDLSTENLLKQLAIEKTRPEEKDTFIPHLTSMFAIQKKNGELIFPQQDSKWIIYLTGHGGPAYLTIGKAREQYNMIQQSIANARNNLAMGSRVPADVRNKSQAYIREYEPRLKEYEEMVQGRSSWQSTQMVPESAQIAGITAPDFAQLMTFFDESLDTAYVHYVTCFAGGYNQTFVNETLSSLNVKFVVSSQGIHEGYTSVGIGMATRSDKPGIQVTGQDFAEFFKLLRMFFTQQEEFVKIKGKAQDPIHIIIKAISSDEKPQNQPFVRFPGAGFFVATPLTKKTKTLTKTIVKAHEIENKSFDLSDPNINVVIINTPRINVAVNLGKKGAQGHTALVTPSPASFAPGYEGLLLLKEVHWQDTMQSLLFNISYLNTRMYPQTFVINTLKGILLQQSGLAGTQGSAIKNFIMHMRGVSGKGIVAPNQPPMLLNPVTPETVQNGKVGTNIHVAFELDEYIYSCFFAIQDIENTDGLARSINTLKFTATPKKSINMNTFAQNFVTQQEIAHVAKPITLESMATFIDDKIDKQDPSMAIWSEADHDALLKMVEKKAQK